MQFRSLTIITFITAAIAAPVACCITPSPSLMPIQSITVSALTALQTQPIKRDLSGLFDDSDDLDGVIGDLDGDDGDVIVIGGGDDLGDLIGGDDGGDGDVVIIGGGNDQDVEDSSPIWKSPVAVRDTVWVAKDFTRTCTDSQCVYTLKVDQNNGNTLPCTYVDTTTSANSHSFFGVSCHPDLQLSWGWSPDLTFTTMTIKQLSTANKYFFGYFKPNTVTAYPDQQGKQG